MCKVRANDNVHSDSLLSILDIYIEIVFNNSRIGRFGHVERTSGWISQVQKLDLDSSKKPQRPKKTWNELVFNDKEMLGIVCADPLNRFEWKADFNIDLPKSPTFGKGNRL